jgi:serine/threonine-protein kinase
MPIPLKKGKILRSRYKIKRIIGQGGMGSIYLCEDTRLDGRLCALKEVEHNKSFDKKLRAEAREQFFKEATILAKLDHPNLPKVSDFFSIKDRDYLVMDYVPGDDLRTLMLKAKHQNKFLVKQDVINWANQLADALIYLHNQDPPILHRDIKPSNLKLTANKLLKLVDFGLVKVLAPGELTVTVIQGQGTAIYTPLEQYGGDSSHTDTRSDIYSFGATLYHLFTNTPPSEAKNRFISPDALDPPRSINPLVSNQIERAILWAMSLHPDERPQSMTQLKDFFTGKTTVSETRKRSTGSLFELLQSRELTGYLIAASVISIIGFLFSVF